MKRNAFFLCGLVLFFLPQFLPAQVTITLDAAADNTLYFDPTGSISNGIGPGFFCGSNSQGAIRRALVKFDIAGNIPANATITAVSLQLTVTQSQPVQSVVTMHLVTQDWGEGNSVAGGQGGQGGVAQPNDATWLHTFYNAMFWNNPGGDFNSNVEASQAVLNDGVYTWTSSGLVNHVQNWLINPASNFGWILLGSESSLSSSKRFASREFPTSGSRPKLIITYTQPCTAPDLPVLSLSQNAICPGSTTQLQIAGNLNDAAEWGIYTTACGTGLIATTSGTGIPVSPTISTTYYIRGEGGCVFPGACASVSLQVLAQESAQFSYSDTLYCLNSPNPLPVIVGTGGGGFSAQPASLVLNSATGQIDMSASPTGTYLIQYLTPGLNCPDSAVFPMNLVDHYSVTVSDTICSGESYLFGNQVLTTTGAYVDSLISLFGCDSVVQLMLFHVQVSDSVLVTDTTLTAFQPGATYQWMDCQTNLALSGETGSIFVPATNGSYAVQVSRNGCTDTSVCYPIVSLHAAQNNPTGSMQVYPNPASSGEVTLEVDEPGFISITDAIGRLVFHRYVPKGIHRLDLSFSKSGVYFIFQEYGENSIKLLIQK